MKRYAMKVREKFQVTIPKDIREYLNLEIDDYVLFVKEETGIFLEKAAIVVVRDEK